MPVSGDRAETSTFGVAGAPVATSVPTSQIMSLSGPSGSTAEGAPWRMSMAQATPLPPP